MLAWSAQCRSSSASTTGLIGTDPGDQRGERVLGADLERLGGTDRRLQIEPFDQCSERRQPGGQPGDVVRRARPQVAADRGDERLVRHRRRQLPRPCVQHVVATRSRRLEQRQRRACSCRCRPHPPPRRREPSPRRLAARRGQQHVSFASLARPARRPMRPLTSLRTYGIRTGYRCSFGRAWLSVDHDSRIADPSRPTRSPEHLTHAVALIGAVRGALRSGLMEALWRWQPCTTDELAVRAHLVPRAVDLTLHALAAGGVVAEDAGGWTLQAPPAAWAGLVGFDEHICNFIETGAPTSADGDDRYVDVLSVIGRFHETDRRPLRASRWSARAHACSNSEPAPRPGRGRCSRATRR